MNRMLRAALAMVVLAGTSSLAPGALLIHRSADKLDLQRQQQQQQQVRDWHPQLSELPFFFEAPQGPAPAEPSFLRDPAAVFVDQGPKQRMQSIPGETYYDVKRAPRTIDWWKMPIYAVAGFPRDLVDGAFGAFGYVPILNATTGAYELSGAQFLMRSPSDCHAYGGGANANRHGWLDGEQWGFFSNFEQTQFSHADQAEYEAWKSHNAQLDEQLRQKNEQASTQRFQADLQAVDFLEQTLQLWKGGNTQLALARLHNYCQVRPEDYRGLADYLACLMAAGDHDSANAAWLQYETRRVAAAYPPSHYYVLSEAAREIATMTPDDPAPHCLLAWTFARMDSPADATEEGGKMIALPAAGLREYALYMEIATQRLQNLSTHNLADLELQLQLLKSLHAAVGQMQALNASAVATQFAVARLDVLEGRFDQSIAALRVLAQKYPNDSAYAYQLGVAYVWQGMHSAQYNRAGAVTALKQAYRAAASAKDAERQTMIRSTLDSAKTMKAKGTA